MWYTSMGGNPNDMAGTGDEGHTRNPGQIGHLDELGLYEQTGLIDPNYRSNLQLYRALVYGSHRAPHGATGLRLPGAPSRTDTMLAWLASGEQVIDAFTTQKLDRSFGPDWPHRLQTLQLDLPRFASGGRAGAASTANRNSQIGNGAAASDVHVFIFNDEREAIRRFQESPAQRKIFKRSMDRNR
jgi:hypothetical protein